MVAEIIDLTVGSSSPHETPKESPISSEEIHILAGLADGALTTNEKDSGHDVPRDAPKKPSGSKRKRNRKQPLEAQPPAQDVVDDNQPPLPAEDGLFFVDLAPMALAAQPDPVEIPPKEEEESHKLLLPAHVSVFGTTPVEILAPTTSLEEDSIQFLDYDGVKVFHRYWEEQEPAKVSRIICKHCGGEGHKGYECPVLICLTCGARDDHPTRSCPISKVCFNCGMRGHINANCPNRGANGIQLSSKFVDCERCSSSMHKTNECPTWWRMYSYLSDSAQAVVISYRKEKQGHKLGEGGEGYIADDEWCYACGNAGHLGDDCEDSHRPDQPREPSAFSFYNVASGPFYDPEKEASTASRAKHRPRPRESFLDLEKVPDDVGRRGRDKARSKLTKAAQSRVEDDPDDWFNKNRKNAYKQAATSDSSSKKAKMQLSESLRGGNKRSFDQSDVRSSDNNQTNASKSSLLDRLGDHYDDNHSGEGSRRSKKRKERQSDVHFDFDLDDRRRSGSRRGLHCSKNSNAHRSDHSPNHKRDGGGKERSRDRDRDRDKDRNRFDNSSHRPRYKGGYSR